MINLVPQWTAVNCGEYLHVSEPVSRRTMPIGDDDIQPYDSITAYHTEVLVL